MKNLINYICVCGFHYKVLRLAFPYLLVGYCILICWCGVVCSRLSDVEYTSDEEFLAVEPCPKHWYAPVDIIHDGTNVYALYTMDLGGQLVRYGDSGRVKFAENVTSFTPAGNGVAYTVEETHASYGNLIYCEGEDTKVFNNVVYYCWNGNSIVYISEFDYSVYIFDGDSETKLFSLDLDFNQDSSFKPRYTRNSENSIISNDKHLIVSSRYYYYHYTYETSELKCIKWPDDWATLTGRDLYLFGDNLFVVSKEGDMVYNFADNRWTELDLSRPLDDVCFWSKGIIHDGKLYLTIKSFAYSWTMKPSTLTVSVDLDTLETEIVNDRWYSFLWCDGGNVGGWGNGKFSVRRDIFNSVTES